MRKFLAIIGLISAATALNVMANTSVPDNTIAFSNCTAKVKVDAARLRSGPSLNSKVVGVRLQDSPLFVTKVCGKWVQVAMTAHDTAYIAAYLLAFPADEILEQWKRSAPAQSVGKKARVKWAAVNYRKYPSAQSASLGHFKKEDEVAVLANLGNGWSLVESQDPHGTGSTFGFIANSALAAPLIPDPEYWTAPLAMAQGAPPKAIEPEVESLGQYCSRTAWTPELFVLELKSQKHRYRDPANSLGETLLASR